MAIDKMSVDYSSKAVDNSSQAHDHSTQFVDDSPQTLDNATTTVEKAKRSFVQIDELCLLKIASFLSGPDLLNFSHLNSTCFHLIGSTSDRWSKEIERKKFSVSPAIEQVSYKF